MTYLRWLLALAGWLGPNALLVLALGSIPPTQESGQVGQVGSWADWMTGWVVFLGFMSVFLATGMASIRLALHAAPEASRVGLARVGRGLSLTWIVLMLAAWLADGITPDSIGFACLGLWGLGHFLGSRWRISE